jgi:hypothetical protein
MKDEINFQYNIFRMLIKFKPIIIVLIIAMFCFVELPESEGAVIYESATFGTTAQTGGPLVNSGQFLGVRFQIFLPTNITSIGGHFLEDGGDADFFGAIVALTSFSDFPDSSNLSTSDVIGSTLLSPPAASNDVSGSISLTLTPGIYSLVFGSGLFGATGSGLAPSNNTDIGSPSYFFRNLAPIYLNGGFSRTRFFVEGTVVPIPGAVWLLGSGVLGIVGIRRKFRK